MIFKLSKSIVKGFHLLLKNFQDRKLLLFTLATSFVYLLKVFGMLLHIVFRSCHPRDKVLTESERPKFQKVAVLHSHMSNDPCLCAPELVMKPCQEFVAALINSELSGVFDGRLRDQVTEIACVVSVQTEGLAWLDLLHTPSGTLRWRLSEAGGGARGRIQVQLWIFQMLVLIMTTVLLMSCISMISIPMVNLS